MSVKKIINKKDGFGKFIWIDDNYIEGILKDD